MSDLRETVRAALHQNLIDTTGACICNEAYIGRGLIDPHCGYHEALPTTDDESVDRVLALLPATVKPDVEWLAREMHTLQWMGERERAELAWDRYPYISATRQDYLRAADAILAAWPGRTEQEVREDARERIGHALKTVVLDPTLISRDRAAGFWDGIHEAARIAREGGRTDD